MPEKLLIFPFGGNGREAAVVVDQINRVEKKWEIVGFVDDDVSLQGKESCGIKVVGGREVFSEYPDAKVLVVPGGPDTFLTRKNIINELRMPETRFATIIHPSVFFCC